MKKTIPALLLTVIIAASCCGCASQNPALTPLSEDNLPLHLQVYEGFSRGTVSIHNHHPEYIGEMPTKLPVYEFIPSMDYNEKFDELTQTFGIDVEYIKEKYEGSNGRDERESIYAIGGGHPDLYEIVDSLKWQESYVWCSETDYAMNLTVTSSDKIHLESSISGRSTNTFSSKTPNIVPECPFEINEELLEKDVDENAKNLLTNSLTDYLEKYKSAFGFENPCVSVELLPTSIFDKLMNYRVYAYSKKPETNLEKLLWYNGIWDGVTWDAMSSMLDITSDDCYSKIGEYDIITADEAFDYLKENKNCGLTIRFSDEHIIRTDDEKVIDFTLVYARTKENILHPIYIATFRHDGSENIHENGDYQVWVDAIKY